MSSSVSNLQKDKFLHIFELLDVDGNGVLQYEDFRLLASTDDLRPFDAYPRRRDFSFSDFNTNAVLRWEYRPGSSLYVVWSQARGTSAFEDLLFADGMSTSPFDTSTSQQFADTFGVFPENVFLVKLSYLVMR